MKNIFINAVGDQCPLPVIKATRALREMTEPGELEVRVDNTIAVENLKRMAQGNKLSVTTKQLSEKEYAVVMTVTEPRGDKPMEEPEAVCTPVDKGDFVVCVDTDCMGRGSDELGKTLIKGFIYAVSQLPKLPSAMVFYNGGAHLTTKGSASLDDLKAMQAQGVRIITCGTCLNYYGLTDQLAVGSVSNMYEIVETLTGAGKVIKP